MSPDLGTNTILFQGVGPYSEVGIGNIKLIYNDLTPTINNLQIYFNNVLLDIVKTYQSSWTEYSYSFPIAQTGSYSLLFQGQPDIASRFIGITNIRLYEPPTLNGPRIYPPALPTTSKL